MKRFGFVIRVEPGEIERYKEYHRSVWPEVLHAIRHSNIRNYSIFLKDDLLFGYYEYHGLDHAADMARIADDITGSRIRSNPGLARMLELPPDVNISLTAPKGERPVNHTIYCSGREIPPEDLPIQAAGRTGQPVMGTELEIVFTDGRSRILYGNASPLFDEDGTPRGSIGAYLDVTEWRRVEAALKDNEQKLWLAGW